jgi:hypothetical protein
MNDVAHLSRNQRVLAEQHQAQLQVTHQHLQQRPTAFWQKLGRRVLHFTWSSRGEVVLDEALGLQVCPSAQKPRQIVISLAGAAVVMPFKRSVSSGQNLMVLSRNIHTCTGDRMP